MITMLKWLLHGSNSCELPIIIYNWLYEFFTRLQTFRLQSPFFILKLKLHKLQKYTTYLIQGFSHLLISTFHFVVEVFDRWQETKTALASAHHPIPLLWFQLGWIVSLFQSLSQIWWYIIISRTSILLCCLLCYSYIWYDVRGSD